jgi:hypothetical protein
LQLSIETDNLPGTQLLDLVLQKQLGPGAEWVSDKRSHKQIMSSMLFPFMINFYLHLHLSINHMQRSTALSHLHGMKMQTASSAICDQLRQHSHVLHSSSDSTITTSSRGTLLNRNSHGACTSL